MGTSEQVCDELAHLPRKWRRWVEVLRLLHQLVRGQEDMMSRISDLQAADAALDAEVQEVIAQLRAQADSIAQLQDLAVNNPDLQPIIDDLNAQRDAMAAALTPTQGA